MNNNNSDKQQVSSPGRFRGASYISSGRFIWKRCEHKKTEEGTSYSTEIIATAATETDATDITNRLNAQVYLLKTLTEVQEKIRGYAAPAGGMSARNCLAAVQKILKNVSTEQKTVSSEQ